MTLEDSHLPSPWPLISMTPGSSTPHSLQPQAREGEGEEPLGLQEGQRGPEGQRWGLGRDPAGINQGLGGWGEAAAGSGLCRSVGLDLMGSPSHSSCPKGPSHLSL
ncbi:unnamed protein product [Eretmochelys imbricata]